MIIIKMDAATAVVKAGTAILIFLCLTPTKGLSKTLNLDNAELLRMREDWEACCRSNKTLCINGSCYSVEWRAAAWAAVRSRCRGRFSDWPFAVDIMKMKEEKDIEKLWSLLSKKHAYPNDNSALPVTVWTSGTRCPNRGPTGIVVRTKWASNQPFPSWLESKMNDGQSNKLKHADDSCKFLVITPKDNSSADFNFEEESAKHVAVCEFLFPDIPEVPRITTTTSAHSTPKIKTTPVQSTSTISSQTIPTTSTTVVPSTKETSTTSAQSSSTTSAQSSSTTTIPSTTRTSTPDDISSDTTVPETTTAMDTTTNPSTYDIIESTKSSLLPETSASTDTETSTDISSVAISEIETQQTETTSFVTVSTSSLDGKNVAYPSSTSSSSGYITTSVLWTSYGSTGVPYLQTTESGKTIEENKNFPGCKETNVSGILWPPTPPGETANRSCPHGMSGFAQWECDKITLKFSRNGPTIHQCKHNWINKLEDEISEDVDAVKITSKLADHTNESILSHGDIAAVVQLAERLMELFAKQKLEKEVNNLELQFSNKTFDFTKSLVATYSNVLQYKHKHAWKDLPQSHQRKAATNILRHTETAGRILSCSKKTTADVQFSVLEDNINLQTFMFNSSEERLLPYIFPQSRSSSSVIGEIVLPAKLDPDLWPSSCGQIKTAVGVIFTNVGNFLTDESQKKIVGSSVLGFSLGNNNAGSIKLPEGVKVTVLLKHAFPNGEHPVSYSEPRCVFWNFSKGLYGDWDDSGCQVAEGSNFSYTRCTCDHLTNFAILMDVNNNLDPEDPILDMMTMVCCSMSAIVLAITFLCLTTIKSMRCRRSTITSNLCVCLLVMNVLMVFGLDRTENAVLCAVIAGILQYSLIGGFCWMLLEAHQLYQMVVLVFYHSDQVSLLVLYMVGYGVPLVIVGTSAGIRPGDYGGKKFCWLSNEHGLMWSFVGVACAIILANFIVFVMTIKSASTVRIKKEQKTMAKIKGWVKGSASILCLLGLTWIVGLIYMEKLLYSAAYLFTILNGLQGVFIFIFHVLLNEKVGGIFKKLYNKELTRQITKSTILYGTSSSEQKRTTVPKGKSMNINGGMRPVAAANSQQNIRSNSVPSSGVQARIRNSISSNTELILPSNRRVSLATTKHGHERDARKVGSTNQGFLHISQNI